ncbi:winged helix-turn-helix domain-containing protein [Methanolobus sp.]|uniref:helix-turn-helix transcriptional regulator n=1 Tax=Methanolobus sp. TaxID=1874737 RepID=UPI0025CECFA4|nr:winged helix-turn-helix domain-containing protein [Methanolobus sp.]
MTKALLDVIFASGKRKGVLQLLKDGPQEMEYLLKSLDTTRQALLPQIRTLEDHYLIDQHKDAYQLTIIGKLLVDKMTPFLETIEVLDANIDYWGTHNIDFIPPHLLKEIKEIKNCEIINPPLTDLYSLHKSFHLNQKTESTYTVTNFLYPDYCTIFTDLIDNGITVNYIVSKELFDKIKIEHCNNFQSFMKSKLFNFFSYNKKMNFLFFTFDDFHIVISLLKKDGDFDSKFILCSTQDALNWGKEMFDYYLNDSVQITQI